MYALTFSSTLIALYLNDKNISNVALNVNLHVIRRSLAQLSFTTLLRSNHLFRLAHPSQYADDDAVYPKLVGPSPIIHIVNKHNNFHCVLTNAYCVSNKIHDILVELLTIVSPDILFITKTWLDCDDVFIIPENLNYSANIIRCDRKSCGRDVLVCINVNIPFKLMAKMCTNDCTVEC